MGKQYAIDKVKTCVVGKANPTVFSVPKVFLWP